VSFRYNYQQAQYPNGQPANGCGGQQQPGETRVALAANLFHSRLSFIGCHP
jgi:hypothetical protein